MTPRFNVPALMLAAGCLFGQTLPSDYSAKLDRLVTFYKNLTPAQRTAQENDLANPLNPLTIQLVEVADVRKNVAYFARYVAAKQGLIPADNLGAFLGRLAQDRLDVQNGAGAGHPGTTSVLTRAGASEVLGIALESGAVTQSVSGQSLTLSANALSLYRFATTPRDVFRYCLSSSCGSMPERILDKISGTTTFSLTKADPQTVSGTVAASGSTATANTSADVLIQNNHSRLTGFTVRYQIHNAADLHDPKYLTAWKDAVKSLDGKPLDAQTHAALGKWITAVGYDAWIPKTTTDVLNLLKQGGDTSSLALLMTDRWEELIKANPIDTTAFQTLVKTLNTYLTARDAALQKAREKSGTGETVEYTYSRPASQPRTSNVRFIMYWHPGMRAKSLDGSSSPSQDNQFTLNAAVTFYDNPPAGTGAVRDIQAALGWDHHFGAIDFALAGYYQYQQSAAALQIGPGNLAPGTSILLPGPAATLLAPKKSLVVGQATITIPMKNGAKIPFGITVANRSELVKGTEVRGHVGFTFDWTSLFASKPSE